MNQLTELGKASSLPHQTTGRCPPSAAGPTPKFMSYKYSSWVVLDAVVFEMEMAYLNDIRGTGAHKEMASSATLAC